MAKKTQPSTPFPKSPLRAQVEALSPEERQSLLDEFNAKVVEGQAQYEAESAGLEEQAVDMVVGPPK